MLSPESQKIPEEFCRIRTRKPGNRERQKYKASKSKCLPPEAGTKHTVSNDLMALSLAKINFYNKRDEHNWRLPSHFLSSWIDKSEKWLTHEDIDVANSLHEERIHEIKEMKKKALEDSFRVKESALKYKATNRIKDLAQPRMVQRKLKEYIEEIPFVNPSALKYMPTKRILELARPKEILQDTLK